MGLIFPGLDFVGVDRGGVFVLGLVFEDSLDIEIVGVHDKNIFIEMSYKSF